MTPAATPPPAHVQPVFAELRVNAPAKPGRQRNPYGWSTHVVRRGDTLSDIAARHNTTVGALVRKNHLAGAGHALRAGQTIAVPRMRPAPILRKTTSVASYGSRHARYAVRPGDTLGGIAQRYGVGTSRLARFNKMGVNSVIRPGQRLIIPGARAAARRSTKDSRASAARAWGRVHVVKAGDTLSGIATKHGVSQASLMKANRLRASSVILPGQRLRVVGSTGPVTTVGPHSSKLSAAARANRAYLRAHPVPSRTQIRKLIVSTARRHGVDHRLALAIGWQESGWNQRAVSQKNALGVMQCLPSTGQWMSGVLDRRLNLLNARDNITCGVALLRTLGRTATSEKEVIAAYYQGMASVRQRGIYDETTAYVVTILALKSRM